MFAISTHNLKKRFEGAEVFEDFTLCVEKGKITAIFGPNGSGKSTLLNILSGITPHDGGQTHVENVRPFDLSYIFQNYRESLLPWRTNFENVALPLQIQQKNPSEIQERIKELQTLFTFNVDWNGYPYQLSGGQQQMLAFMRALITHPDILLIDEPFSALDYENNLRLREHLQTYYLAFKPTILLITHNIEEAVHLAEKIAVFSKRPTKVLDIIDTPLPYPRTIHTLASPEFKEIRENVLSLFQKAANV